MDIEGHEDRFLAGAAVTIAKLRPVILMETNDAYYERRGVDLAVELSSWMRTADYVSAVMSHQIWKIAGLEDRKPGLDNILLLPRESATVCLRTMNSR